MSDAYLHVGMHKTATTSIQRCLHKYSQLLKTRGLYYLDAPEPNHSLAILAAFEKAGCRLHEKHFRRASDKTNYLSVATELRRSILTQFDKARERRASLFISGEAMYHLSIEGMGDLKDELQKRFEKIYVIGLVRPPLEFAESYAQEQLKIGMTYAQMLSRPPLPRYRARFGKYIEVFSKQNVRLAPYSSAEEEEQPISLLSGLMSKVDSLKISDLKVGQENVSLCRNAAKILSAFNKEQRHDYDDTQKYLMPILKKFKGDKAKLPIEVARFVVEESQDDAEWIESVIGCNFPPHIEEHDRLPLKAYAEFGENEVAHLVALMVEKIKQPKENTKH